MSGCILLAGAPLSAERGAEILRDIAPLLVGRSLALEQVERARLPDDNGGSNCWRAVWRDGDIEVVAVVENGPGNPRDGYGYVMSVKLMGPYQGKHWWRAELYGSGWDPVLPSPIRLGLLGPTPAEYEAIRARVVELLPEHRDVTFEVAHAVGSLVQDFAQHGHDAWVRDFLRRPILPDSQWASASLCERKIAMLGPDVDTSRRWISLTPASTRAWQSLADAGGDASTSVEDARFLAALTHPFSARAIDAARASASTPTTALAAAMAHVFRDPRWRWIDEGDRECFDETSSAWVPAPSRRVVLERPTRTPIDGVVVDVFQRAGFSNAAAAPSGPVVTGRPLAEPGVLSHACGVSPGHSLRRAALQLAVPAAHSHAVAICHTNCEDRLSTFAIGWFDPQRQLVLRTSLSGEPAVATRTPIEIDVIDTGDGTWADAVAETLST